MDVTRKIMSFDFDTRKIQSMHFHQDLEIIYVLDGVVEITIETESYQLEKGDFLLVNANKRHSVTEKDGDTLIASFRINFSTLAEYMETNQLLFWCNTTIDKSEAYDQLKRVLDRILNRYYDKEKEGALYLNSIYYEAVYILTSYFMIRSDDSRLKLQETPDHSRVFEIQNYIQSNYHKQISLNDLANKLYLSNAYLSKYIKKRFGLSFLEYVNNIRLFHAVDELLYSDKKITRIALDNGFATTTSFNKAFKDVYGVTPSAYRADVRNGNREGEQESESDGKKNQENIDQRVKEYLSGNVIKQEDAPTKNMDMVTVDTQKITPLKRSWSEIINIGEFGMLLESDMQKQVLVMKEEIGFRYVRIWNVFEKDMYEEKGGQYKYNFSRVDRALDFLVENHLKPYIELSFKPINLAYTIDSSLSEKDNGIIFHGIDSYEKVMVDMASHLINRYGVAEVESWYFELWKDERMNMLDENGWYFQCFEAGYCALKKISDKLQVGGAGFALGYERYQYRDLIRNWKKRKIKPDFISVYSYAYLLIQQDGLYFGKRSLDINFIKNQLDIFKQVLEEEDFVQPAFHMTQWNFTISNRNCINDSCAQGAYVMKNCIDLVGNVDKAGYWYGSDLNSEYYDTETVLYGDNGLLTRDGIKKPSFYAFHFMNFLQSEMLGKTAHSLLTTNGRDTYTIACHNCKQFSYRYTMKEEQDISIEDMSELYEDMDAIHLKYKINHVKNGEYIMRMFYVNKDHGSIQDIWRDMSYITDLSKGEIDYMCRSAMPKVEMQKLYVEDGVMRIETKLQAHEIKLIDIHYIY